MQLNLKNPAHISGLTFIGLFVLLMIIYYTTKKPSYILQEDKQTGKISVSFLKSVKLGLTVSLVLSLVLYIILYTSGNFPSGTGSVGMGGGSCTSCSEKNSFMI